MKTEYIAFEKESAQPVGGVLDDALEALAKRRQPIAVEEILTRRREVIPSSEALRRTSAYLSKRGIRSPASLVEMRLRGEDFSVIAKDAGLELDELHAIVNGLSEAIAPEILETLAKA